MTFSLSFIFLALVTYLSRMDAPQWWARVWAFPRPLFAIVCAVVLTLNLEFLTGSLISMLTTLDSGVALVVQLKQSAFFYGRRRKNRDDYAQKIMVLTLNVVMPNP